MHINSNVYTGADSVACIQLWSLHEQCHQLSGWGVVSLLYLLACALLYRYLNNMAYVWRTLLICYCCMLSQHPCCTSV
jgi:hypothetical protein